MCDLYRVLQDVLTVARPVLKSSEELYEFRVKSHHTDSERRFLPGFFYHFLNFLFRLLVGLLYPRRVNPSVHNEFLEGESGYFSPQGVEGRENDYLGGIVYYQVDPGELFESSYVPSFPSYYPSLHVVGWECDGRDGHLTDVFRGVPLYGYGYYPLCLLLDVSLYLLLYLLVLHRYLVPEPVFRLLQNDLSRFLRCESRYPHEILVYLSLFLLELFLFLFKLLLELLYHFLFLIERFFSLRKELFPLDYPLLELFEFFFLFSSFLLELFLHPVYFFPGLHYHVPLYIARFLFCFLYHRIVVHLRLFYPLFHDSL